MIQNKSHWQTFLNNSEKRKSQRIYIESEIKNSDIYKFERSSAADLNLEPTDRQDYARHELQYFLSQYYYGEILAAEVFARLSLLSNLTPEHRASIQSVVADESYHAKSLKTYLVENFSGGLHVQATPIRYLYNLCSQFKNPIYPALAIHMVVEALGSCALLVIIDRLSECELKNFLRRILIDEAEHMTLAQFLVTSPNLDQNILKHLLMLAVVAMRSSSASMDLYGKVFDFAAVSDFDQRLQNSRFHKKIAIKSFSQVMKNFESSHLNLSLELKSWFEKPFILSEFIEFQDYIQSIGA